ncbi:MAG TPA: hypothetical protein VK689_20625, partial [Armatimonadota bacterium]|nr:hypothetical protein [Armatimonadota bacterium]
RRDPYRRRGAARAAVLEAEALHTAAQRVSLALAALVALLQRPEPPSLLSPVPEFDLARFLASARELERGLILLSVTLDGLRGDVPPDLAEWTSEQVPLFYFDSVEKVIKMLVPAATRVGDDTLRGVSDASTVALETATQDLLKARAEVSDARREIAERQEDVRQVRLRLEDQLREAIRGRDAAQRNADRDERRTAALRAQVLEAQRQEALALAEFNRRKGDFDALPEGHPDKETARQATERARLTHARVMADRAKLEAQYNDQTGRDAMGDTQLGNAQTRVDQIQGQLDGAEGPLSAAQARLEAALTAERTAAASVRGSMATAFVNAMKDVRDFARARDNAPFLRTEPDLAAQQTDPVKRVMLAGFPDSRVLFIRGRKEDVDKVKGMVAQLDRPQAQALLTLYTLELNSKGTTGGARNATRALQAIDEELRISRAQTAAVLDLLRDCVREEVAPAVAGLRQWYADQKDSPRYDLDAVRRTSDDDLAARAFFHPQVSFRLGWRDEYLRRPAADRPAPGVPPFIRATLPQPGRTSSLAETLVVISLAPQRRRHQILQRFKSRVDDVVRHSVTDLGV